MQQNLEVVDMIMAVYFHHIKQLELVQHLLVKNCDIIKNGINVLVQQILFVPQKIDFYLRGHLVDDIVIEK